MRYNMKRSDKERKYLQGPREEREGNSSDWEFSSGQEEADGLASSQKIDDLHGSLDRLREYVGSLPESQVGSVPTCVREYYDKIREYRIERGQEVIQMGERRLNKMLRNKKIKRNWNGEDIHLLVWLVSKRLQAQEFTHFSQFAKEDWEFISSLISGSSWQKCKFRWLSLKKVKLVTNKWSKEESQLLSVVIAQNPRIHWKSIAQKLYQKNDSQIKVFRTAKQCREHWNCFLNPSIQKGPWSLPEDRKLLQYVLELEGSKKWSEISKFMEGRTQNALKNRYNLLMSRQRKISGNMTQKRLVKVCLNRLMLQQGQHEQLGTPPPLPINSHEEGQEEDEEQPSRQLSPIIRQPIVPRVVQSVPQVVPQFSFGGSFNGFYNYIPPNMGMAPSNPIYIGFVFPNQYLQGDIN